MDLYNYHRALGQWKRDASISAKNGHMIIHPIEPLYLPEAITDFLEVNFDEIMIEPRGTSIVFLTFPIEIGVFVEASGAANILDVVSFKSPKYSLYGSANRGVITRWHRSKTYSFFPQIKNYEEGILRLEIQNTTTDWVSVSRVVIFEKGMRIYFNDRIVSMSAEMIVTSADSARVTGVDKPLREGMTPSLRMYEPRLSSTFSNMAEALSDMVFVMDSGLS